MDASTRKRKRLPGRMRSRLGRRAARIVLRTVARTTDALVFYLEGQGEDGYGTQARARMWGVEPMEVRPHSYPGQPWHHIPECSNRRCVGGQQASDKEMVVALCYLRDLIRGEEPGMGLREADIGYVAARIARAHLARSNRTLPGLCEDPADPDTKAIFRQAWPWHLPYAGETGGALLTDYWDERYVSEPFMPSWERLDSGIPF